MENFDALFEMVAKIAQEISVIKIDLAQTRQEVSFIKSDLAQTRQEVSSIKSELAQTRQEVSSIKREMSARFDHVEKQLNTVIEQVAGLTEFKNETTIQMNKLLTIVAEHSADIRLLKKVSSV
jgi:uncharacterized coiled-coil DUF342 family protein